MKRLKDNQGFSPEALFHILNRRGAILPINIKYDDKESFYLIEGLTQPVPLDNNTYSAINSAATCLHHYMTYFDLCYKMILYSKCCQRPHKEFHQCINNTLLKYKNNIIDYDKNVSQINGPCKGDLDDITLSIEYNSHSKSLKVELSSYQKSEYIFLKAILDAAIIKHNESPNSAKFNKLYIILVHKDWTDDNLSYLNEFGNNLFKKLATHEIEELIIEGCFELHEPILSGLVYFILNCESLKELLLNESVTFSSRSCTILSKAIGGSSSIEKFTLHNFGCEDNMKKLPLFFKNIGKASSIKEFNFYINGYEEDNIERRCKLLYSIGDFIVSHRHSMKSCNMVFKQEQVTDEESAIACKVGKSMRNYIPEMVIKLVER